MTARSGLTIIDFRLRAYGRFNIIRIADTSEQEPFMRLEHSHFYIRYLMRLLEQKQNILSGLSLERRLRLITVECGLPCARIPNPPTHYASQSQRFEDTEACALPYGSRRPHTRIFLAGDRSSA